MIEPLDLDLAIVRNRLLAGKIDMRDEQLLQSLQSRVAESVSAVPRAAVVHWAISNAIADIASKNYHQAARELDLVHNVPLNAQEWAIQDEEYFLKGSVSTYMESAPMDRLKALFLLLGRL